MENKAIGPHIIILMGAKIQYLCAMDYKACLDYLYAKLPMFSRIGTAALKLDLSNTVRICEALGHPERKIRTIHVAGTNGKGSVSHLIASVLQEQGYRTGLYTSPHLHDFRERIKINGNMIPHDTIIRFTQKMMPLIDIIQPSFFELTVGMAFEHFADEKVDFAVIETGMGGRLDSTNVITPLISVITNIGFDHVSILGDTLEKIAFEKAGIIKEAVPVIIGKKDPHTLSVFESKSKQMNAPILFAGEEFETRIVSMDQGLLTIAAKASSSSHTTNYTTPLAGIYQTENTATVLTALQQLKRLEITIDESSIQHGFLNVIKNTGLHGRWESICQKPNIVLDVAHNPDGMRKLCEQINITPHKNLFIIIGMSNDKDVNTILEILPQDATYGFTKADLPRAMEVQELAQKATAMGLIGECFTDVNHALKNFKTKAAEDDLIIVCGSIFLVGEVKRELLN